MLRTRDASCAVLGACLVVLLGSAAAAAASTDALHFENSCSNAVAANFDQAVAQLHSFEYPESTRLFREILATDPDCAMARWGIAMSAWAPLWAPPSAEVLRATRQLLADAPTQNLSAREQAYLAAVAAYFNNDDPMTDGARRNAYSQHMHDLYREYRADSEAALFYALSLLGVADPKDKSYANQYRSAAILSWVRESHPTHPGVLHYLIHAYDYPELAHLALRAAKTYAQAAPDSAHAQHMPSHIFTRLGLWELAVKSNEHSTASAAAYTRHAALPGFYDEGLHSIDYEMYALLQTVRDEQAAELLGRLRKIEVAYPANFKVAFTNASAPARYVLERRDWQAASTLPLGFANFDWTEFSWAESINHFARGIGAARSGQPDAARRELAAIGAIREGLSPATQPYFREQVAVHEGMVAAWIEHAVGNDAGALAFAAAAADREDSVDKHPVTPGEVLPARELYADLLAETGQAAAALAQYQAVLKHAPNRFNALLGAARAAGASGRPELQRWYYAAANRIAISGGTTRAGLLEARRFLQ